MFRVQLTLKGGAQIEFLTEIFKSKRSTIDGGYTELEWKSEGYPKLQSVVPGEVVAIVILEEIASNV